MTLSQGDGEIGPATSEHDCGLAGTDQRHVVAGLPDVVDVVKAGRCVATGHGGRRAVHHPLDGAIHLNLTSASSPIRSPPAGASQALKRSSAGGRISGRYQDAYGW